MRALCTCTDTTNNNDDDDDDSNDDDRNKNHNDDNQCNQDAGVLHVRSPEPRRACRGRRWRRRARGKGVHGGSQGTHEDRKAADGE